MPLTKEDKVYFKEILEESLSARTRAIISRVAEDMKMNTRDIIAHFNASQGKQNERMDRMDERFNRIDTKLDAIMDVLVHRIELENLVHEIKAKGLQIDETKIFVAPKA